MMNPSADAEPFVRVESDAVEKNWPLLNPRRSLRPPGWLRRSAAVAALGAFLLSALLFAPEAMRQPLRRTLWPWGAETAWAEVSPGNARIPSGGDVVVSVRPRTPSPAPILQVREQNGPWEDRSPAVAPDGTYHLVLERVVQSLGYRARRGALRTETYQIAVFTPPTFENLVLKIRPPAYTGRPEETWKNVLALRAPTGSVVEAEGLLDRPVREARLIDGAGNPIPVFVDGRRRIRFRAVLRRSGPWKMQFTDAEGNASETLFAFEAAPDEPPRVTLLSPEGDTSAENRARASIVYDAEDDYGLSSVRLLTRINGGEQKEWVLPPEAGLREFSLVPRRLGAADGDRVEGFLEARDNNPERAGAARSGSFSLTLTNREEERRRTDEDLERWRESLLAARTDESLLRGKLDAETPAWDEVAARQRLASEGLRELADRLEGIVRKMESDPGVDPWLTAEHRAASEALRGL